VTLKSKLSLTISLLVLLITLAVSVLYVGSLLQQQVADIQTHADFLARALFNEIAEEMATAGREATPPSLEEFLNTRGASRPLNTLLSSAIGYPAAGPVRDAALVDAQGRVMADSNPLLVGQVLEPRPALALLEARNSWRQFRTIFGTEQIYEVALPLQVGTTPAGAIRIGVDTALVRAALRRRLRTIVLSDGALVLLAVLGAMLFSDFVLSPLAAVSAQLDWLSRGELLPPTAPVRHDEFGQVSSKIEALGRQMQDVRHVYSTLQENVTQVLDGLAEGIVLFSSEGRALMASAAVERYLQRPVMQLAGRTVEEIFAGASPLEVAVRDGVRSGVGFASREFAPTEGRPGALAGLNVLGPGPSPALLLLRDAAGVHRLEDELAVARRLSAVGRLTRGVAHEVKNPLNAMAIHLDLLQEKSRAGAGREAERHLDIIRHEIARLDRVVRAFLDFSKPVEMQLRNTDLMALAGEVAELARAGVEEQGIILRVVAQTPQAWAWVDRDLIEQALLNLVNNAVQAMRSAEAPQGEVIRIEVASDGEQATVRVRDQGPGIAAEVRDRLFDLYFTTRPEGNGIGLALVARAMQLHNGAVEVESEPGAGASFILYFPVHRARPGAMA